VLSSDDERNLVDAKVTDWAREQQRLHARILGVREVQFREGMRVLDLGCGDGTLVEAYGHAGFEAYGCDFDLSGADGKLLPIARQPYRLPFPDRWFDAVVSHTVMEHVENWDETLSEVARVMKPSGCTLHLFPARLRPIEPHVLVPFAGVLRSRWWLRVWAWAGVRNLFQHGMTNTEVVAHDESFLNNHTA
jgi:SAM-dependent methyltransferase